MPPTDPILDTDTAAFVQSGVGISLAACGNDHQPLAVRGFGCRVSADRRQVTVFTSARQAGPALDCLRKRGLLAVVFSHPPSHRTVQLKANDACVEGLQEDDPALIVRYREAFVAALASLGYDPTRVGRLFLVPPADVVAIRFTPLMAFSQTPGPRAGELLRGAA